MKNFLLSIFAGPKALPADSLHVAFHMTSGAVITTTGVSEVKITKTNDGGIASYSIEWHAGFKPAMFTLTLDHISAIVAHKVS